MRLTYCYRLFFILALGVFIQAGAFAQTETGNTPINAETSLATDIEIRSRLRQIFSEIDGLKGVSTSVSSGVVRLSGNVQEETFAKQATTLAERVEGVVTVISSVETVTSVEERLEPVLKRTIDRLKNAIALAPLVVVAILVWSLVTAFGWWVSSWNWPWMQIAPNIFIANFLRQIIWLGFIILGAIFALDILGATAVIGTVLGAAGIVGLAIGFAVRDTVENYIASILLSIRQPFRPKDYVSIEGHEGFVLRLTSRATILLEQSGNHIRIPNSTVFKSVITNYSRNPERRFEFKIGVDADSDLKHASEVGIAAVNALEFVLFDPGPDGWIEDLGDSNVILTFIGWIDQTHTSFPKARSEAMRLAKQALEDEGFSLPEPIYRLRFDDTGGQVAKVPLQKKAAKELDETTRSLPKPRTKNARSRQASDVSMDTSVTEQIDLERSTPEAEDLLSNSTKSEL